MNGPFSDDWLFWYFGSMVLMVLGLWIVQIFHKETDTEWLIPFVVVSFIPFANTIIVVMGSVAFVVISIKFIIFLPTTIKRMAAKRKTNEQ